MVGAVLPCTNENAHQLVQRCHDRVRAHETTADLPLRMVAKTFQPRGDLSLGKVRQQLDLLMQQARQQEVGVLFQVEESAEPATPGMLYTDQ